MSPFQKGIDMGLPKPLQMYWWEVSKILEWLGDDWLDQDTFYEKSRALVLEPRPARPYDRDGYMMPFYGDPMIQVIQWLILHELVDGRKHAGKIEYRRRISTP